MADKEPKNFLDRLFASGKDALSAKNIIARVIVVFIFTGLLGIDLFIKYANDGGLMDGLAKGYWGGLTRGLSSFWYGVSNMGDLTGMIGSFLVWILITIALLGAFYPIVKTFIDIIDMQQGQVVGNLVVLAGAGLLILAFGFWAFSAGVDPVINADDATVADSSIDDNLSNDLVPQSNGTVNTFDTLTKSVDLVAS